MWRVGSSWHDILNIFKHISTHTNARTHTHTYTHDTHTQWVRGKRSWRNCCILAPLWPSWRWSMTQTGIEFAKDANQRDLTSFSERCITVFLPATFSHWVPTPSWRQTAGTSRLTSLNRTTRSCWRSLAWRSMTEKIWPSTTQVWTCCPVTWLFCRDGQHPDLVKYLSSGGQRLWLGGGGRADGARWLLPGWSSFAGWGWPLISAVQSFCIL